MCLGWWHKPRGALVRAPNQMCDLQTSSGNFLVIFVVFGVHTYPFCPTHTISFKANSDSDFSSYLSCWSSSGEEYEILHAQADSLSSVSCFPIQLVCPEGTTAGDTQGNGNAHFCVIWKAAIMALPYLVPQLYVMSAQNSFIAVHLRVNLLNL